MGYSVVYLFITENLVPIRQQPFLYSKRQTEIEMRFKDEDEDDMKMGLRKLNRTYKEIKMR